MIFPLCPVKVRVAEFEVKPQTVVPPETEPPVGPVTVTANEPEPELQQPVDEL